MATKKQSTSAPGELVPKQQAMQVVPRHVPTPYDMIAMAVEKGCTIEYMKELMGLQERWEANEARKAFTDGMAAFKTEVLTIEKTKQVSFRNKTGGKTEYVHAELHSICDIVVPALARHGFSHSWTLKQDNNRIMVGCVLTHRMGHSQQVEMVGPPDESGGKNTIQAIASTKTYLERYTLLAITGLATGGVVPGGSTDDDGAGDNNERDDEPEHEPLNMDALPAGIFDISAGQERWLLNKAGTAGIDSKDQLLRNFRRIDLTNVNHVAQKLTDPDFTAKP